MTGRRVSRLLIVGAGLVGASVGLAARRAGHEVTLSDVDAARVSLAVELGVGEPWRSGGGADLVVVAVPPDAVASEVVRWQQALPAAVVTDVASVKSAPIAAARRAGADLARFVGGHPMAGRERSGPAAARADLFAGRPWVLTPMAETAHDALAAVTSLVVDCDAVPMQLDPQTHDRAVALVSHLPQLVASLLAAGLADAPEPALALAGQGLRDTTRLAGSDPGLWADILGANAHAVADALADFRGRVDTALDLLRAHSGDELRALLAAGAAGRGRVPGKRGAAAGTGSAIVPVLLDDRPAQLAGLLADVAALGINVEDLVLEHAPGQPVGLAELAVRPCDADALAGGLRGRGWRVRG